MSAPSSPTLAKGTAPVAANAGEEPRISPAGIDASLRSPLLFFFACGTIWLVLGVFLALIASIKLHAPGFLAESAWLTFGRVRPASMNAILYGFASQTALGVLLWLICRLGAVALCCQAPLVIAGAFWNLGVTVGVLGILAGGSTGFEWLEMPRQVAPILFASYALIGLCALITFHFRAKRSLYVSEWYLLAALFWFPWIYSAANFLLLYHPVRGVMQSVVNAWFTNNLLGLWLAPVGLAAIYYFIPKLSGRPLYSQYIAALGFWTLAIFTNWTGLTRLIGGPVPAWMPSASIAASALMIVPVLCVALNWHLTLAGRRAEVGRDVTGRFIVFGALAYLLWSLLNIVSGLRDVSALTQFTFFGAARNALGLLGFFTMTMFGAIYYIVPRLTGVDWPSGKLIRSHATCSTGGILISVGALFIAGLIQGAKGRSVQMDFLAVIKSTLPWVGLATLGLLLFLIGQLAFLKNFLTLLHIQVAPHRKSAIQFVCGAEAARPGGNV